MVRTIFCVGIVSILTLILAHARGVPGEELFFRTCCFIGGLGIGSGLFVPLEKTP